MEGIDLDQPAKVLWWADSELPKDGTFTWGGSDREFQTLRAAINFVFGKLSDDERATALVLFDGPPGTLDFRKPETTDEARQLVRSG